MKKNQVKKVTETKKLRLSRETLQTLTSSDTQKVVGGTSPQCSRTSYEILCDTQ